MAKRGVDLLAGSVLALLAVPVVAALAVVLAWSLRCWPFFVQERVGLHGRTFRLWKLRTLPRAAPANAHKYAIRAVTTTPLARFLRRTHLDELPQLLLVPFGPMTLVGPRPEMTTLHRDGEPEFARARTSVRPGCTGLWQISVEQHRLIWEAPQYDLFYLRHAGLRLDAWVLARSVLMVLGLRSTVTLAHVPPWILGQGLATRRGVNGSPAMMAPAAVADRSRG
ncbi:MAG: sugar transferase [Actinobacteria bacterium]|nr:sugar transferase [Actinomycetota bacterium]